ncbi:MAG: WD40 repeat domain-containing protein [Desulfitobacteriaceae bacterium]
MKTGKCLHAFREHTGDLEAIAISEDNRFVITGGKDKTAKLWSIETGECIQTLEGHGGYIKSAVFSADSQFVVTGSNDSTAKIWDVNSGECIKTLEDHSGVGIDCVKISKSGRFVVTGMSYRKTIMLWEFESGKCIFAYDALSKVKSVAIDDEAGYVLTASENSSVKFWGIHDGELKITVFNTREGFIWTIPPDDVSPKGWFWTDKPENMGICQCYEDSEIIEMLPVGDQRREEYVKTYNRQDIVMSRLNDYENYKRLTENIIGSGRAGKLSGLSIRSVCCYLGSLEVHKKKIVYYVPWMLILCLLY